MVVVFIAVSQLQTSRRDNERKAYANLVFEAMEEYYKNNGRFIDLYDSDNSFDKFLLNYMPDDSDPSTGKSHTPTSAANIVSTTNGRKINNGASAIYTGSLAHNVFPSVGQVYIAIGHICFNSTPDPVGNGPILSDYEWFNNHRNDMFSVVIYLEHGRYFCLDDQQGNGST
jgi:hypothetical protein